MYDTKFIVKYKSIEEELINKINNGEEEYTKDDVYSICEELYRHELLNVFQVNSLEDIKMKESMDDIWDKIQTNKDIMIALRLYGEKILLNTELIDINNFIMMFNYDFFYLLHDCICQIIENKTINKDIIDNILLKINNL